MSLVDRRLGLLFACFLVLFSIALMRAAWLQAVQGGEFRSDAQSQQTEAVTIPGVRGTIYDRRGSELALSEDAASVFATPFQIENAPKTAAKLADVLDTDESKILELISNRESGFEYLARKVDLPTADKIEDLDVPGVGLLPDSRRVYPEGELASQVIGAVGIDNQGLTGLEAAEEETLGGDDGERIVTRDALGAELERSTTDPSSAGSDLTLTIDASIQATTERVIQDIGETSRPIGATAIVMDPQTSEILAMANWPRVDPYNLDEAESEDLINMATSFTYEPGSTFKAFTVGASMEERLVTPHTTFDLPPSLQVADRLIEESHPRGYATMSVADILAQSSNVGAVTIGMQLNEKLGDDTFDTWIRKFGFGEPTGIDFPGEEQGIVLTPKEYSGSSMGNLPLGQGLSVTPIQIANAYAAIANGGVLNTPQLVLSENGQPVARPEGVRVMSEANAARLREMLEGVLEAGGTASAVQVPGYVLAGKTGTAQKVVNGEYSESAFVGSFVGFAPAEDPKLLVSVVVDTPTVGSYYGGDVAAPAFGEIANFALPHLDVPPDR
ncbi:MAG TPA: penicillin-binding protein 2 [Solirubrobacterales bacterium]|nr:penicillin-binding protein 2 [Solirubrobacterales bacterium]